MRASKYRIPRYKISFVKEEDSFADNVIIKSKGDVKKFLKKYLQFLPIEMFCVIAIDSGNRVIAFSRFEGCANTCAVFPRVIFKFLLDMSAVGFVVCHNHPGGVKNPSKEDWDVTKKMFNGGKAIDVLLVDHFIVADDDVISLREMDRWDNLSKECYVS